MRLIPDPGHAMESSKVSKCSLPYCAYSNAAICRHSLDGSTVYYTARVSTWVPCKIYFYSRSLNTALNCRGYAVSRHIMLV